MEYKYKAVVFDMDGTVLDTLDDLTDTLNYALGKNDLPLHTKEEVRMMLGNGMRALLEKAVPDGKDNPKMDSVFQSFKEYYHIHCNDKTHVYDGILDVMKKLKEDGIKIAIVSNKVDSAVKELDKLYFAGLTDVAIGEKAGIARKPAPDTVYEALRLMNVEKEDAIYVGDSEVDYQTAVNAGIPCISVLWGFRTREFLEDAGAKFFSNTPDKIFSFLAKDGIVNIS